MERRQFLAANAALLGAAVVPRFSFAAAGTVDDPDSYVHKFADLNGIRMHYIDEGKGPLVILLHGFPLFWYSWRHQIAPLVAAGFRVVVPDQRGYGQTSRPEAVTAYDITQLGGDVVALIAALNEKSAILVGWDWGTLVTQFTALVRPDLIRGVALVVTPVGPRAPMLPSAAWKLRFTDGVFYQVYFQRPGTDAELNADPRRMLTSALYSLSGSAPPAERWRFVFRPTDGLADNVTMPAQLPPWLSQQALDYYVAEFSRSGFTGPLNWYRNIDRNWEITSFLAGARIQQPTVFIGGSEDPGNGLNTPVFDALERNTPNLTRKVVIPGVGHMAPDEKPAEVNAALLEFLKGL